MNRASFFCLALIGVLANISCAADGATAIGADCTAAVPLVAGTSVDGFITSTDCNFSGDGPTDVYSITLASQTTLSLSATTKGFTGTLIVAMSPNASDANFISRKDLATAQYVVLPAGTYLIAVAASSLSSSGSYTLQTKVVGALSGCLESPGPNVVLRPGISISGTIAPDDCVISGSAGRVDYYEMYMVAGKTFQATTTGNFGLRLESHHQGITCQSVFGSTGAATFTCIAPVTATYNVNVANPSGSSGTYTLSVSGGS